MGLEEVTNSDRESFKNSKENEIKKLKFLVNQDHNLVKCPICGLDILKNSNYCFKCGSDLNKIDGINKPKNKNPNKSNKNTKPKIPGHNPLLENDLENKIKNLEEIYNDKIANKYPSKFKFGYVVYLNQLNKNPLKPLNNEYFETNYGNPIRKFKEQAQEDGFVGEGSPLLIAKSLTVKDLKNILKKHELKVSGRKDELIKRLNDNLSEEELKKEFPKNVLSVTRAGLEFIEENKQTVYFDKNKYLRFNIKLEEFDSVFDGVDNLYDEKMYDLTIKFLKKRELTLVGEEDWEKYTYNFNILTTVYKDKNDDLGLLDSYFKVFISGINNFSVYTKKSEPSCAFIISKYLEELLYLMHKLRLDVNELKNKFNNAYSDLKYPELEISEKESYFYLLRAFSGEESKDIVNEIRSNYAKEDIFL